MKFFSNMTYLLFVIGFSIIQVHAIGDNGWDVIDSLMVRSNTPELKAFTIAHNDFGIQSISNTFDDDDDDDDKDDNDDDDDKDAEKKSVSPVV